MKLFYFPNPSLRLYQFVTIFFCIILQINCTHKSNDKTISTNEPQELSWFELDGLAKHYYREDDIDSSMLYSNLALGSTDNLEDSLFTFMRRIPIYYIGFINFGKADSLIRLC